MTPEQRAEEFASSERFLNLVAEGKKHDLKIRIEGLSTVIECSRPNYESVSNSEWTWDKPDSEDFIYRVLVRNVEIYSAGGFA